jgi:hypothetical protein
MQMLYDTNTFDRVIELNYLGSVDMRINSTSKTIRNGYVIAGKCIKV